MAEGREEPTGERTSIVGGARNHKKYGSTANRQGRSAGTPTPTQTPSPVTKHPVTPGDTLQGIALRYGVTTEQIRRLNRIWTNDSLFLRTTLDIPVPDDSLVTLGSDRNADGRRYILSSDEIDACVDLVPEGRVQPTGQQPMKVNAELTLTDMLSRIDSAIAQTKNKVQRLDFHDESVTDHEDTYQNSSRKKHAGNSQMQKASSDPNVVPHTVVMTQGRKVRSSLQRLEREQDELFEL